MTHKSYSDILHEHSKHASIDDMEAVTELTSEYVDAPYDKHEFLQKVEDALMPFLTEDVANEYVQEMHNLDGSMGAHWSMEQISAVCAKIGLPVECSLYGKWDMYVAANMMWSDLYDPSKPVEMYIKDAYRFLKDKDFPKPGKMKWYVMAKEKLEH